LVNSLNAVGDTTKTDRSTLFMPQIRIEHDPGEYRRGSKQFTANGRAFNEFSSARRCGLREIGLGL